VLYCLLQHCPRISGLFGLSFFPSLILAVFPPSFHFKLLGLQTKRYGRASYPTLPSFPFVLETFTHSHLSFYRLCFVFTVAEPCRLLLQRSPAPSLTFFAFGTLSLPTSFLVLKPVSKISIFTEQTSARPFCLVNSVSFFPRDFLVLQPSFPSNPCRRPPELPLLSGC